MLIIQVGDYRNEKMSSIREINYHRLWQVAHYIQTGQVAIWIVHKSNIKGIKKIKW